MSEQDINQKPDQESVEAEGQESEQSFFQYTGGILGTTLSLFKGALFFIPIVVVVVIVALALLGPSVGNVFSNIVSSL
jgi:hypothetical protein